MSEIVRPIFTEKSERKMSCVAEASILLQGIAGAPARPVKAAIGRAVVRVARYLPMSFSRIEDIWYEEVRLIRAEEIDAIRAAAAERQRKQEAGRAAAGELANLYLGVAERLRSVDEDFHCAEISRLERNARALGAVDRSAVEAVVLPVSPDREAGK